MTAAARTTDSATSHQAAADVLPKSARHRRLVLLVHYHCRDLGLTDFELAELTGLQQTSCGKRRGELMHEGLIGPALFTRPSPSGSAAAVWQITPAGIELAAQLHNEDPS